MGSEGEGTQTNQDVRQLAGVEGIEDTLTDVQLCWYSHDQRKDKDHHL